MWNDASGQVMFECYYFLARENVVYYKKFLTIMDVIIEFGGLSKGIILIVGILVSPIYYKGQ